MRSPLFSRWGNHRHCRFDREKVWARNGGLFLAFPAIFPASATLVEKHEREKKEEKGLKGIERGKQAASQDAMGAAMGSLGLLIFAVLVWLLLPEYKVVLVLIGAGIAWLLVSCAIWALRQSRRRIFHDIRRQWGPARN